MNILKNIIRGVASAAVCGLMCSCGGGKSAAATTVAVEEPVPGTSIKKLTFNADSAYRLIERQLDFGYRVPGTADHDRCGEWLAEELARRGADTVIVQKGEVTAWNGDRLPIANIMGSWNPEKKNRILLLAHWDSRPWADQETDKEKQLKPIPGANDGASGVGVLLELARGLKDAGIDKGIDILLVDAEDYGSSDHSAGSDNDENSWCLGTQYWLKDMPYKNGEKISYAILLDMVGGYNAKFHREYFSNRLAPAYVDKVWSAAAQAGHGSRFVNEVGSPVVDDHLFLLKAGIPAVDIIECGNADTGTFNPTWHTHADGLGAIDRETLRAAGETVAQVLMNK